MNWSAPRPPCPVCSLAIGLLSLAWVSRRMRQRGGHHGAITPPRLALGTAIGLGLHTLSESLALGSHRRHEPCAGRAV